MDGRTGPVGVARAMERAHLPPLAAERFDLVDVAFVGGRAGLRRGQDQPLLMPVMPVCIPQTRIPARSRES
jgi:hypothetical protein